MKTGIIGYGYWGKIIESKLDNPIINPESFDNIDALFVSTPPDSHFEVVKKGLLNKKHIFCEKPLTLNYDLSQELINLSYIQDVDLYVDNLFLYRDELKFLNIEKCNNITFNWFKKGPYKDNLINDLFYHDLYILIHFLGNQPISSINYIQKSNDILFMTFNYGNTKIKINYDRNWEGVKTKTIIIDNQIIDLSFPKNDPLQESIDLFLNRKIDLKLNHKLSLDTNKLLELFT